MMARMSLSSFPCRLSAVLSPVGPARGEGLAKTDHPACSRHEGQADLSPVASAKVECQHANASPRQVPGHVVIVHRIAPRLPSQHGIHRHHHQGSLRQGEEKPLLGCQPCFPLTRRGRNQTGHHWLSAAARGGNLLFLAPARWLSGCLRPTG